MNTLRGMRRVRGFSQSELARLAGIDQATFSKIERGLVSLGLARSRRVAVALNVPLSHVLEALPDSSGRTAGSPIQLRSVLGRSWGRFSEEEPRMHVQTWLGDPKEEVKVWLEDRGRRTFLLAKGRLNSADEKILRKKVQGERSKFDRQWIALMIARGWLEARLQGSTIVLTAYKSFAHKFTRTIDLREKFPGYYTNFPTWTEKPPIVDFDVEHAMLRVGRQGNHDEREHIPIENVVFTN